MDQKEQITSLKIKLELAQRELSDVKAVLQSLEPEITKLLGQLDLMECANSEGIPAALSKANECVAKLKSAAAA